jgi:hypothetical protein
MTFLQVFNKHVIEGVKVDYDVVKAIALEYAEVYSKQVLEIAAKEAIADSPYHNVDKYSILNIQLPEHT